MLAELDCSLCFGTELNQAALGFFGVAFFFFVDPIAQFHYSLCEIATPN